MAAQLLGIIGSAYGLSHTLKNVEALTNPHEYRPSTITSSLRIFRDLSILKTLRMSQNIDGCDANVTGEQRFDARLAACFC